MRAIPFLCASLLSLAVASSASATVIIGGGPPGPGLGGDEGAELYLVNLNPNQKGHIVLVKESFDAVPTSIPHSWGFYFAGDPSTRFPVFTSSDEAKPPQQAVIDFDAGRVVDLDALALEAVFAPSLSAFGFYLEVELPTGTLLTFSEAARNGGVDTFASFPFLDEPLFRVVAFQVGGQVFALQILDGAIPVPEPSLAMLLSGGLAALVAGRRRLTRV